MNDNGLPTFLIPLVVISTVAVGVWLGWFVRKDPLSSALTTRAKILLCGGYLLCATIAAVFAVSHNTHSGMITATQVATGALMFFVLVWLWKRHAYARSNRDSE